MIVVDDLFQALADAHAIVGEFDTIEDKLQAVGLDAGAVHTMLRELWAVMLAEDPSQTEEHMFAFVRGFVEGLLVGKKL